MTTTEIAKEILNQIRTLTPMPVLWSWGASAFKAVHGNAIQLTYKDVPLTDQYYLGGLMFYVRGAKHRGNVFITLEPSDTYRVSIGQLRKGKFNAKDTKTNVYFEDLPTILDSLIEQ